MIVYLWNCSSPSKMDMVFLQKYYPAFSIVSYVWFILLIVMYMFSKCIWWIQTKKQFLIFTQVTAESKLQREWKNRQVVQEKRVYGILIYNRISEFQENNVNTFQSVEVPAREFRYRFIMARTLLIQGTIDIYQMHENLIKKKMEHLM